MNRIGFCLLLGLTLVVNSRSTRGQDADGFRSVFNGKDLFGWAGDQAFWSVTDGSITGIISAQQPLKGNQFLTWNQGSVDDFELKLRFRITGTDKANSGIQFRCQAGEDGHKIGYQADIDRGGKLMGSLYDERTERKTLAARGQSVRIDSFGTRTPTSLASAAELWRQIHIDDWNDYHVRAYGNRITVTINGHKMSEVVDLQIGHFDRVGQLALQLHGGPPMKVQFKDIRLKRLPLADNQKKIVFLAGKASHGWGAHEHRAGCLLLADRLNEAATSKQSLAVLATVYQDGWPEDPTALDNANTVVVYTDGGKRHYLHSHGEAFEQIMRRGVGLVCIHYGVEIPKGLSGQRFLNWIGGYFETHWSVNPHWLAKFESLPDHPVTRGVQPFEIEDEWYYHMRFVPEMTRVTPILSAMPPIETLQRKDGPHHNNPSVRESVLEKKQPQHVAWAFVRGDGRGRGFGFTGGHWHRNWQNDDFRMLMLNAIAWTAHVEIPDAGVASKTPSAKELDANQDYAKPADKP